VEVKALAEIIQEHRLLVLMVLVVVVVETTTLETLNLVVQEL
jgi:hypothetical protein